MLLALDTSTPALSVALLADGHILATDTVVNARAHTELLSPMIESVLATARATPADLTRIVVGVGPGPFTGLRVGLVTARTLGHVLGIEVVGVCSLDVIAAQVVADLLDVDAATNDVPDEFVVATDARRKEVYSARYKLAPAPSGPLQRAVRLAHPSVMTPDSVATDDPAFGNGASLYPTAFTDAREPLYPKASSMALAVDGHLIEVFGPEPWYLRSPDVTPAGPRKSALN